MSFYCLKYAKLLKFPYLGLVLSSETDIFSKKPAILTSCNCFVRVCKHTAGGLLPSPLTDRKGLGGGLRAMRDSFRHKNKRTENFHAMRGYFRHKNKRTENFHAMRGLFRHKNISTENFHAMRGLFRHKNIRTENFHAMRGLFRHKNISTENFCAMRGLFRHKNIRTENFCAMRGLFRHKNIRFLRNSWFKKNLRVICGKFSGIFTSEREQWAARQATNWSRLSPPLSMQVPHWSPTAAGRLAEMKNRH